MADVLAGIRVVEVASWTFVPSACAILAEWGAEVIKVEDPVRGDPQRGLVSSLLMPVDGVNFLTELPNRGKCSVGIDIKSQKGREILDRLLDDADVFVTNYLPAVRQRLGIDVDQIRSRNPGIIYARGSALGPKGREAGRGGFDAATYWARGGIASALTPPEAGRPIAPRNGFGDYTAGMALAGGIAAALVKRARTGEGSVVDVALLNVAMWQLGPDITSAKLYKDMEIPQIDRDALPNPLTGTYGTSDGRHITLMMIQSDPCWEDFCHHIDQPDLAGDPRFCDGRSRSANSRELTARLREVFAQRSFRQWCDVLDTLKGVWAPVHTPIEVHDDPQVKANGFLETLVTNSGSTLDIPANPVQFDERPPAVGGAPELGAQTEAVLLETGFTFDEILELKNLGAVL